MSSYSFWFPESWYQEYENFNRYDPALDTRISVSISPGLVCLKKLIFKKLADVEVSLLKHTEEHGFVAYAKIETRKTCVLDRIVSTHAVLSYSGVVKSVLEELEDLFEKLYGFRALDKLGGHVIRLRNQRGVTIHKAYVPRNLIGLARRDDNILTPLNFSWVYDYSLASFMLASDLVPERFKIGLQRYVSEKLNDIIGLTHSVLEKGKKIAERAEALKVLFETLKEEGSLDLEKIRGLAEKVGKDTLLEQIQSLVEAGEVKIEKEGGKLILRRVSCERL
ncbi:hypothetical protein DRP04_07570 [Archaeoglobales archaeon]|nr:MAG: hypothetical protein DRP04_07570 [Archaeoglobales archaeon]